MANMDDLCKPPPTPAVSLDEESLLPSARGVHFKLPKEEELLGSVTTHNCPGTRASARVIQKRKQDQTRPMTPPPSEWEHSKKEKKAAKKTPSQLKAGDGKTTWTNVERIFFFDALNQFGKAFEAVASCINAKLKRRNASYSFKTKDQVRQHYYQTYHKICKYVRYSEELKKPAQELYTLINYGEMRRKLQFLTEKHFMKLKQLVYQGQVTVRCKGKNIRIKTPSCKALRRLNQLDDSLEDIRLPSKCKVLVTPANMEAFGRVQSLAQNPRGMIIMPLHKKLISFIKTFEYKWRSANQRLNEEKSIFCPLPACASASNNESMEPSPVPVSVSQPLPVPTVALPAPVTSLDPSLCFQPRPGVAIHRPLLSITAYLSSINICLSAYEERLGFKVRSETLGLPVAASKRRRPENGSENRSAEAKKPKRGEESLDDVPLDGNQGKQEKSRGDELVEEIQEFLGDLEAATSQAQLILPPAPSDPDTTETPIDTTAFQAAPVSSASETSPLALLQAPPPAPTPTAVAAPLLARSKRKEAKEARNFRPLLSDKILKSIRKGWTEANAADITIGDLYVVLGQDSKLELEYYWCEMENKPPVGSTAGSSNSIVISSSLATSSVSTSVPVATQTGSSSVFSTATTDIPVNNNSLITASTSLPYNPNDCDSEERVKAVTTSSVGNKLKHLLLVANLSERVRKRQCNCGHTCDRKRDLITKAQQLADANRIAGSGSRGGDGGNLRTHMLPVRRPIIDPVRQLSALTRQKISRQVLVQRRHSDLFEPIDRLTGSSSGISSGSSSNASQQGELQALNQDGVCRDMPNLDFCVATSPTGDGRMSPTHEVQDESTTKNCFHGSVSPMHLLRDSTSNAPWLEDNINDYSLTSLLGHLDEIDDTMDILDPSSSMSAISESSADFRHKFQKKD